jgi:ABC-type antimicrobial peptide transport system ATPase subunit
VRLCRLSDPEPRFDILLNVFLLGLTYQEFAGKYSNEFSGGQLQRISIPRALLTNPTLLIAHEPVSMVDASLRMSIVNLFKKLRDELGVSILYITLTWRRHTTSTTVSPSCSTERSNPCPEHFVTLFCQAFILTPQSVGWARIIIW